MKDFTNFSSSELKFGTLVTLGLILIIGGGSAIEQDSIIIGSILCVTGLTLMYYSAKYCDDIEE